MLVQLNGEPKELSDGLSLGELIRLLELPRQRVAIELNGVVVRRRHWDSTVLTEGDRVEIVHFVGGGCGFASTCKSV